jgi:PadR family transcriptional regulator, regulatory protein PadR
MISIAAGPHLDHLEACLLLSLAERPAYGYQLKRSLAELDLDVPDLGRIYRTLRSMEERGLVESRWDTGGSGPARRTYELTAAGGDQLQAQAAAVRRSRRALTRFLGRYERLALPHSGAVA